MAKRKRHPAMKSDGRNAVSYIFAFILSIVLVLGTLLLVIKIGCFTKSGFHFMMDDDYYKFILEDINDSCIDYTLPTGFDISVVDNVFSLEDVTRDVNGYISAAYDQEEYSPDVTAPSGRLTANVNQFYADHQLVVDTETEDIIGTYVDEIMDVYRSSVKITGLNLIMEGRGYFDRIFGVGMSVVLIMSVILIVLLLKLHRFAHRGLRFVAYAFGAAAIMVFAFPFWMIMTKIYERISLSPQYFYHFAVSYIRNLLLLFFLAAGIWVILTLLTILAIMKMKKAIPKSHRHKHH